MSSIPSGGLSDLLAQPGRPAKAAQREAILKASLDVFVRDGFAANVGAIAAAAGVARRTVFNHFRSKDAMFDALLERTTATALPKLALSTKGDVRTNLLDFAQRYVAAVTGPDVILIYHMLRRGTPGSLLRFNEVQRRNYRRLRKSLATYFARLIRDGTMKPVSPRNAAERFLASVVGMSRVEISLGFEPDRADPRAYIREAVDGFLDGVRR